MNGRTTRERSPLASDLQVIRKAPEERDGRRVRVAAYCRVSTNLKIQESSLEIQMASFRQRIAEHPGWTLVDIYADKGLTGTTASGRVAFQKLIEDAADGKIDYIMAKSISRFARNTVDALSYTRRLKEMGVGVYFEEQALDTLSASSEIFLTIHAAFAQEESHIFSENMKRGMRNRFALGIPKWSETYGYRCEGGVWRIHEGEAAVVREIYRLYAEGCSLPMIRAELASRGIPPPKEGACWWDHTLATILHSEKYIGDAEMQKSYTIDCLSRKRVSNDRADIPKYYRKGHHAPIVDPALHALVQTVSALRDRHRGGVQYPFFGYLTCPFCGGGMLRLRLPTRRFDPAWFCGGKCRLYAVREKYLHPAILAAWAQRGGKPVGERVEYKFLHDQVARISFAVSGSCVDWQTLEITWKSGGTTRQNIAYDVPSDIPCTRLEIREGWVLINGVRVTKKLAAAQCIRRVQDFIRETEVDTSEDIPLVHTPLSTQGKSGGKVAPSADGKGV